MKIYAPVKDTNGVYASVRFVNGVGETDKPNLIEWFRAHGYTLEETVEQKVMPVIESTDDLLELVAEEVEMVEIPEEPDFEGMTPNELRDWAKANGYGGVIKNIRNKEKLIQLLRG